MIRLKSTASVSFRGPASSALAAVLCLLAMAPAGAREEGATFRFDPPDGTRHVMTSNTTQVLDFGQGRTTSTQSELNIRYSLRKLPDGYSVTSRVLGGDIDGRGQEVNQLMLEALKGVPVTYTIDESGGLVDVTGMEEMGERLRAMLPPEALAVVGDVFSKETMVATARADWEREVLNYKDRLATPGSVWLATEHYPLQTGEMAEFHVAYKVTREQIVDGTNCVRVEFKYASDPVELRGFLGTEHESLLSGKKPFRGGAQVSGRGHRIVDPATLLPYGQKIDRVIETKITVPSQGDMPVTIRQEKKYWYSYEPAG